MRIFEMWDCEEREVKIDYPVLPCPFCGNKKELEVTARENFDHCFNEYGSACISIQCNECDCQLTEHNYKGGNYDMKLGILISNWNRRANNGN